MDLEQEKEVVARAKTDSRAFGELYEHYYSPILAYILRRTASLETAQDICSEVFFKALHNLEKFHWREVPFSSWLCQDVTSRFPDSCLSESLQRLTEYLS
jgi:RNA polymerase sigma-70 factor, ECF subfamily